ncbi:MAG: serine/threonine protein phosphatase [Puniceicoccaceae bacterium]|nr:serine/threonine protein phosphatase [Puniceicoccaceae bacterium]RCL31869.1 MAG: serine/threonine protein phosphatase [Puniceicoccaceae bacterium]
MQEKKNSAFARVQITYDGRVSKWFLGPQAKERYANEVQVLEYLEKQSCPFVPHLLSKEDSELKIETTNCGQKVEHLSEEKCRALFDELESYGVRHRDQALRNITYNAQLGRFCLIDFEFATILEPGYDPGPDITVRTDQSRNEKFN